MNQWETKQIIEIVSKGVNSILMHREPKVGELKKTANELTNIYIELMDRIKKTEEIVERGGKKYKMQQPEREPIQGELAKPSTRENHPF